MLALGVFSLGVRWSVLLGPVNRKLDFGWHTGVNGAVGGGGGGGFFFFFCLFITRVRPR